MRTNAVLILIWLAVAAIGYLRLPEITYELRQNWQPYEGEMILTSGAVCVWALCTLACLVTMVVYGKPRR